MQHILTVIGTRPQIIKSAVLSRALASAGFKETIVHTGQHYNYALSQQILEDLEHPEPAHHLEIGSGNLNYQVGEGLKRLNEVMELEKPDGVLVYGDTYATLVGALTAQGFGVPLIHIEAGMRSYLKHQPEEVNRVLTDRLSEWLFVPSEQAKTNLEKEGITQGIHCVGDVMQDTFLLFQQLASMKPHPFPELEGTPYWVLTLHRAENTTDEAKLCQWLGELNRIAGEKGIKVIFPVHPRTEPLLASQKHLWENMVVAEPLGYLEMNRILSRAQGVLTDSGGLQKEALYAGVRCLTLRDQTEWTESLEGEWNQLIGLNPESLSADLSHWTPFPPGTDCSFVQRMGNGQACERIANVLKNQVVKPAQLLA